MNFIQILFAILFALFGAPKPNNSAPVDHSNYNINQTMNSIDAIDIVDIDRKKEEEHYKF